MRTVSAAFKQAMKQPVRELRAFIEVTPNDRITDDDDLQKWSFETQGTAGALAMRSFRASYIGSRSLVGEWVKLGFGVRVADGSWEELMYGSFYVAESKHDKAKDVTIISGFDEALRTMTKYNASEHSFPQDVSSFMVEICTTTTLTAPSSVPQGTLNIESDLHQNISNATYRSIIGEVAALNASIGHIESGNLTLVPLKTAPNTIETLNYDNLFSLKIYPAYGAVNTLVLGRDPQNDNIVYQDSGMAAGTLAVEYRVANNEIIDKRRESVIQSMSSDFFGIGYTPFEAKTEGHGWHQLGDHLVVENADSTQHSVVVMGIKIEMDGTLKETLLCPDPSRAKTNYQRAGGLDNRVKNTELIVDKQNQEIKSLVSDVRDSDGVVSQQFSQVTQTLSGITSSVQKTGGNNLLRNSACFQYELGGVGLRDLRDFTVWESGGYGYTDGLKYADSNRLRVIDLIDINPSTDYKTKTGWTERNMLIREYDSNGAFLRNKGRFSSGSIYHSSSDARKISIQLYRLNPSDQVVELTHSYSGFEHDFNHGDLKPEFYLNSQSNNKRPTIWQTAGTGIIDIETSSEAISYGSLSGTILKSSGIKLMQSVVVAEQAKYSFSVLLKKGVIGSLEVNLINGQEIFNHTIAHGTSTLYDLVKFEGILAETSSMTVELSGSLDSDTVFSDAMLCVGDYVIPWQQASGEILNSNVNINERGITVKSNIYEGDYTVISPLEFAGYSQQNSNTEAEKVFSLNKDITEVKKLEARSEISMNPVKVVPINSSANQGWAFVKGES